MGESWDGIPETGGTRPPKEEAIKDEEIYRQGKENTEGADAKQGGEELAKLALLVEASSDLIAVADLEGRCTFLNSGGRNLVGLESGEERERNIRDFLFPDPHGTLRDAVGAALEAGSWQGEATLRHFRTGAAIPVLGDVFVLRSPETGKPFSLAAICRDLTLFREKEEQLRQSQKLDAIGKLAGGVAHDFNNLLTAINGYSDMLLESVPPSDPKHEFLREIRKAGQRAASLTSQLLAYGRKQVLQPKVLELNEVIEESCRLLERLLGENIDLQLDLAPDLLAVKVDPNQVRQIIFNLGLNARDAMPQGGRLRLETRNARLSSQLADRYASLPPGSYVLLEVEDTGTGMSREVQERVFEPFFTTKEVGAGPLGRTGTGLGLSSVYGILQQSGGGIQFESRPGQGTSFRIYLPGLRKEEKMAEETALAEVARQRRRQGSILLVEDEEAVRKFTRALFEAEGYSVLEAMDGASALALLGSPEVDPDLLVTDVTMPRMGGLELAKAARTAKPGIPILFMSGYTEESLSLQGGLEGGTYFLQKPFTPKALSRKVEEIMGMRSHPSR